MVNAGVEWPRRKTRTVGWAKPSSPEDGRLPKDAETRAVLFVAGVGGDAGDDLGQLGGLSPQREVVTRDLDCVRCT